MNTETLQQMYRTMYITRIFEEHSVVLNSRKEIIGSIHAGEGEEAIGAGISQAMAEGDILAPSYRDVSAMIGRGITLLELAGLLYGKECGLSHGKTRMLHAGDLQRNVLPANPILGASSAIAIGAALAQQKNASQHVVVNIMGDGASNEGAVHESMNFAAVKNLPIIFVIVNNYYAWSTPVKKHSHVPVIANRALAYGMKGMVIDGNDVMEVYETMQTALETVRQKGAPVLIEMRTYRWSGHSGNDANVYRSDSERLWHYQNDPIRRLRDYLIALKVYSEEELCHLESDMRREVEGAYDAARNGKDPDPETMLMASEMLYQKGEHI